MRMVARALLLTFLIPATAQADFNPRGRGRTKPKTTKVSPKRPAVPSQPKPESKPTDDALIQRYTGIVINQPGSEFPLQRLAELYRKRDGSLDKLIAEFEQRAGTGSGAGQYNALVALAGIYRQAADPDKSAATYQRAIALQPNNTVGLLALARLHQDQGDHGAARQVFDRALPLIKVDADREQVLRVLMKLALDEDDFEGARSYHQQLVRRAKGSFFVQSELGTELLQRGKNAEAEAEFRQVVKAARGDNRALAPALRDLGQALAKQGKHAEALETLRRALRLTSAQSGLRRQLLDVMVQVYRDADRLSEIITLLEKEPGKDFDRLRLLGGLYEEQGRIEDALSTYRKALAKKPKDLEVRLRLVQLLQLQGDLGEATDEYRKLVNAAPHNPDFVFRLAEALIQQGKRDEAVTELSRLEKRATGDEQIQAALVDFYERVGERERSLKLLERLSRGQATDPQHLVELGDRYYREGETEKAKRTWKRILVVVPSKSRALSILGEVYLDHDMPDEALSMLRKAVEASPNDVRRQKALALALERAGAGAPKRVRLRRYEEALHLWEKLLVAGKKQPRLAQEARRHIITLWGLGGTLERRIAPLERNMKSKPPDLASGRLLAEVYARLKRLDDAERILVKVTDNAKGDAPSLLLLERTLVQQRKLPRAIEVLKRLVKLEPDRAREFYQRMGQYSAEIYEDDDAIRYAAKAVELSPDDAVGHVNLAEMYVRRQEIDRAIVEYRRAIEKNDRLFPAYFALAQLLLSRQRLDEADRMLRRVVRSAVDEELLTKAARASAQINLGKGTLESLERELLPVALANPHKPIYRRLLVEIYGSLTFPLVQRTRSENAETRKQAVSELERIGQRAVKPLLDALTDKRDSQQQIAVELLTHLRNGNASQPLFVYATGDGPADLRVRAMIAAGAPGKADMLPQFKGLLYNGNTPQIDEGDPVTLAAVWGVCQIDDRNALALIERLLESDSTTAKTLATLTLAIRGRKSTAPQIRRLLDSSEHGPNVRAAAAFAMGQLQDRGASDELFELASSQDGNARAAALMALTRLGDRRALATIAAGLVSSEVEVRDSAVSAAGVLGGAAYELSNDPLGIPEGRVDANHILAGLTPRQAPPDAMAKAIVALEAQLVEAVPRSVRRSTENARVIAEALLAQRPRASFGPLSARLSSASAPLRSQAETALEHIASAAVPPFIALSRHPAVEVRTMALLVLSTRADGAAREVIVSALQDEDEQVRRLALKTLSSTPRLETLKPVLQALGAAQHWSDRVHIVEALQAYEGLGATQKSDPAFVAAVAELDRLAREDEFSFVREAALHAVHALDPKGAAALLMKVEQNDPEPRVRAAATELQR